jgi:hypothetical protein
VDTRHEHPGRRSAAEATDPYAGARTGHHRQRLGAGTRASSLIGKWLALGTALAGVGILPKGWQKTLAPASAAIVIIRVFE